MKIKSIKKLIVVVLMLPIFANAKTMIVCEGNETGWNSIFGSNNEVKKTSKTYTIENDKIIGFTNCPLSNSTKIMCWLEIGPGAVPDLIGISIFVDIDRVSGLVKERQEQKTSAESEIRQAPVLQNYISNGQVVTRIINFEGYCRKATGKF